MQNFCTITTYSHLYKTKALADSLQAQSENVLLHILIVDGNVDEDYTGCKFWNLMDLQKESETISITKKYGKNKDKLRWCLKPVFMKFLLQHGDVDKIIYTDNDIFFYSAFDFLFDALNENSFLLTPHYYKHTPHENQNWLEANFRVGLYNAGFAGANRKALQTLQWWADCCLYRCEKNWWRGLFDDQKYLDLIPIIDPEAKILRHKGCNVAGWNKEECKRILCDNEVKIDGEFSVVFIHYNSYTIREIQNGNDS